MHNADDESSESVPTEKYEVQAYLAFRLSLGEGATGMKEGLCASMALKSNANPIML